MGRSQARWFFYRSLRSFYGANRFGVCPEPLFIGWRLVSPGISIIWTKKKGDSFAPLFLSHHLIKEKLVNQSPLVGATVQPFYQVVVYSKRHHLLRPDPLGLTALSNFFLFHFALTFYELFTLVALTYEI